MSANNARFVFLTGTPIINYPNEIAVLYNILRGKIKTWYLKLNIQHERKVSQESLRVLFAKNKILDFMEYHPTSTTLVITRNPFGFINDYKERKKDYQGVEINEQGDVSDADFIKLITRTLLKSNIKVVESGVRVEAYKALPDSLEDFQNYFINTQDNDVKNMELFKRRILGLTSYFRSAQEQLMPTYEKSKDFHVIHIPMSDFQFGVYEEARFKSEN